MCFRIHKRYLIPIISETDILVYKVASNSVYLRSTKDNFIPFYHDTFIYKTDIVTDKVKLKVIAGEIEEGYHAYTSYDPIQQTFCFNLNVGIFIIPKGSEYYYNPSRGEVVADQMKYVGLHFSDMVEKLLTNGAKQLNDLNH